MKIENHKSKTANRKPCDPPKGWRASPERRGLLAKIHIAYPQLHLTEEDYWRILEREFGDHSRKGLNSKEIAKGKRTAKHLSVLELQYLVDYFKRRGWKARPKGANPQSAVQNPKLQCKALRERALAIARQIENGDRRLRGLAKKILGMDRLEWCRDVGKLRRLLAALEKIRKSEELYD